MAPSSLLMAILSSLQNQGQGGQPSGLGGAVQNAGAGIPSAPPMSAPGQAAAQPSAQGALVSSPAATPPMFSGQGPDQSVNPLMQMAQRAMGNPQAQTIPQPPTAPSTSSPHPILAKIMQALSSGMQNFGYGMQTGPQQLQRQALDAQKSEAMARLGMEQAQLAETQRYHTGTLGEESKRTAIESARQQEEAGFHKGTLGVETTRAATESAAQKATAQHQQADIQLRQKELDQQHAQLDEMVRSHKAEEKLGGARIGVEQQANVLRQKQLDLDKEKIQQTFQIQGLQFNRETMEAERKARLDAVEGHYKEHNWMTMWGGLAGKQKDIDAINQDIDAREGKAAGAAGVPNFAPQQQQQQQQTKPARWDGKQWVDATTNQPISGTMPQGAGPMK